MVLPFSTSKLVIMPKSFNSIYLSKRSIVERPEMQQKREFLVTKSVDFEGRPVQQSVYKIDDPTTRNSGYKSSDFALENQIAVGVPQKLIRCSLQTNEIISEINRVNGLNVSENE